MNKTLQDARSFFKKTVQTDSNFTEGFEAASPIQSPIIPIPITIDLTEQEKEGIKKILSDDYQPGTIPETRVFQDIEELSNITKQVKSISAQSVLLHGERIKQAQNLLSNYRDGAFTKWLMNTYGNRQTPYSMLRYYEFYQSAPKEARAIIEAAPKKAVYLLASRDGDKDKKLELIENNKTSSQAEFLNQIKRVFPTNDTDKRSSKTSSVIEALDKLSLKIEARSGSLTELDRLGIQRIIQRLQKL